MDDFKSALEAAGFKVTKLSHRQMKKERKKQTILDWDLAVKGERRATKNYVRRPKINKTS